MLRQRVEAFPHPLPDLRAVHRQLAADALPVRCNSGLLNLERTCDRVHGETLVIEPKHVEFTSGERGVSELFHDAQGRRRVAKWLHRLQGRPGEALRSPC
jgi:hypothetical protein